MVTEKLTKAEMVAFIWKGYFPKGTNPENAYSSRMIRRWSRLSKKHLLDLVSLALPVVEQKEKDGWI